MPTKIYTHTFSLLSYSQGTLTPTLGQAPILRSPGSLGLRTVNPGLKCSLRLHGTVVPTATGPLPKGSQFNREYDGCVAETS